MSLDYLWTGFAVALTPSNLLLSLLGCFLGTLIGALIIAVLSNGLVLLGVSDIWQYIIKGLVIIGAVALDRYRQSGART